MTKRVLVVSYSQTGQLARLRDRFIQGLQEGGGIEVENLVLQPVRPYPFPWPFAEFFNTFPETVHLHPQPIEPPHLQQSRYDLVVLAYSVWFLSPAQPVTAFLQSDHARRLLHGTPVITLIGCRNMWLMAQEKVKTLLNGHGARLIGNVVKTDAVGTAASFITTPLWLLTGRKRAAAWLPEAGIAPADIDDACRFGRRTAQGLSGEAPLDESLLRGMGAAPVNERLIFSERFAHRSFYLWGKLLMAAGRHSPRLRRGLLYLYIAFLITLILTVVPVTALIKRLLSPWLRQHIAREKAYYGAPSGE